ncbi:MAG TPA: PKD domain-containing protein [Opitutaceae bacterium]
MSLLPSARFALVGTAVLALASSAAAADYYATPAGAGALNGSDWANAYSKSQIQAAVNALAAGDTLYLGSGTYELLNVSMTGSGAAGSPKAVVGVDTGGGLPLAQANWSETAPATTPSGSGYAFRFTGTASHWVLKDVRATRYAQALTMVSAGTYSNLTIDNVDADTVRDGIALISLNGAVIKNCDVIRHTKKGFRLASNVRFVTFEACTADGNGGNEAFPNEAYPNGFYSDSSSGNHDNTYIDCVARNQRMPGQATTSYWNGDGFSSESSSYNYTYIRCKAFDNHDGGFDDKARSTIYDSCVALGNKRGFRYWGTSNGLMVNCLSAYNQSWGDVDSATGLPMPAYALWISGSGNLNVSQSTFHNAIDAQVHAEPGGEAVLNDCILSVDGTFSTGAMTGGSVLLNGTKRHAPGAGPDADPAYVAPSPAWTGSPANAFDSQTYTSPEKGYYQATGAANVPPLLTLGALPYTAGMAPLTVDFAATPVETDGTIVSYAWTFGDGGTSAAPNPSHTYTAAGTYNAECTVTDDDGAIAIRRVTIQVIAANAGPSHHVTPAGAGSRNGSSWAHAYAEADLQALLNSLSAGHTIQLGSGTYSHGPTLTLTKSGTSSAPITIQGVDTGAGLPLFDGTFNLANSASSGLFSFGTGPLSHIAIKNLQFKDHGWVFDMRLTGTTDTLRDHITFENLTFDSVEDGIRLRNCNQVFVRNCHVIRYTKKAFRVGDYSSFVTLENCSADCTGGNQAFVAKAIPTAFFCDDTDGLPTIHDITFRDCVARNNGYPQSDDSYWNGDGYSTERGAYNISYIRCQSYNNNDGGFDDKAHDLLYRDCVAAGNKRQFRVWADNVVLENCLGAHAVFSSATGGEGGTGGTLGLWLDDTARVTMRFSTLHNGHIEMTSGGQLTIEDSLLSKDSTATTFWTGSGVTLVRTATYSQATGTDPQYLAPSSAWRGSPLNAYDSALYGLTKGFNSAYLANSIAVNLTDAANVLAAGEIVGALPAANWSNSTTNNQVLTNVADCFGTATTADISFTNTAYSYPNNTAALPAPLTDDAKMMRSQRALSNNSTMYATAAQVPYAAYDVYVYWGGRTPQETVPATMALAFQLWNGTAWVTSETKYIRDTNRVWDGTYNESLAATAAEAVDGNEYVVFRNVTAATFRVVATTGVRTGLCGLQIVPR